MNAGPNATSADLGCSAAEPIRLPATDPSGGSGWRAAACGAAARPALTATAATRCRAAAPHDALARMLDALPHAVAACDAAGAVIHANTPLRALLAPNAAGYRLQDAVQQLARAAATPPAAPPDEGPPGAPPAAATASVRTPAGCYKLTATLVGAGVLAAGEAALVSVDAAGGDDAITDDELRARHGLTKQEVVVARRMADGLSNAEIAERLGVSFYTARNHAERVMRKLGVPSRARVGALLRAGGPPPEGTNEAA
jgi:DNA-binding CsgD family transcriptional regulator